MDARELLRALYDAAVRAVDPGALVSEALGRRGAALYVRSRSAASRREFVFAPGRVALLSLGKAAAPMAMAADRVLGDRVDEALVVGPGSRSYEGLPDRYRTIASGYPYPDEGSLEAGEAAMTMASRLTKEDLLLALLSGGGSSLMASPIAGISLEEKSRTVALLSAAGTPIADINLVRSALSNVKGGRLARAAGAADVVTLVLSDQGDHGWHHVASGPTLGAPPSGQEALEILHRKRLVPLVPAAIRSALESLRPPPRPQAAGNRWSVLLADIHTALEGARVEALRRGADVRVVPELLRGEARAAARRLALAGACAGNLVRRPGGAARRLVTIFGGEMTVTVKGPGRGGRCRELALATAFPIAGVAGAAVLCAGTDGVDHEPGAAGAFVDDTTLARAERAGLDASRALLDNDTAPFFEALGDAFAPGPTGTNVGDVAFVLAPRGGDRPGAEPAEPAAG